MSAAPAATATARSTFPPPSPSWSPPAACPWPSTATAPSPAAPAAPTFWLPWAWTYPWPRAATLLAETGLTFLFAPNHHPALRHAAQPRAELGFRTLLNLVGPAANPAGVRHQLVGVYAPRWLTPMAETLGALGADRAWVVHGAGLDELTLAGDTHVAEWRQGTVRHFTVTPEDAGLPRAPIAAIAGGDAAANAHALRALLSGAPGPYRDTVVLNAAAALVVAGRTDTILEGAALAGAALESFAARALLQRLQDALRTLEPPIPALD